MNLRELELFGTLMRVGTTIETARVLGLSQPAVSAQIKRLEANLGLRLFQREGNRLVPTAEAQALFADAVPIFATQARVNASVRSLQQQDTKTVTISATPAIVEGFLSVRLAQAGFLGWKRRLRLWVTEPETDVRSGRADFGMQMAFPAKADFHAETLMTVPLVAVMQAGHPLAREETLSLADLAGSELIAYDPAWSPMGDAIRSAFLKHRLAYVTACEVPFCSTVCQLVETCGGVGVIDRLTAQAIRSPDLVVRQVRHLPSVPLVLFSGRDRPLRGAAQELIQVLRESSRTAG
ncbi:LysR family transcriptional regulator [Tropicimonas sp. IMCC34043]|uniref:LysR family transcriptional regulator n=1 Tax=Tropicimonas sp. IMCC34043 TaxID=2248760 RepID=UPI000E25D15E|nr:LysR family transcriptional regulator [Tropicimonas sp. IMCC34043]